MFSLIVSIISIALVAVLAAASIYYGGDAFTKGSAKALASTVVTQAQQISSANTLFKNDNGGLSADEVAAASVDADDTGLTQLVSEEFLASAPVLPSKVGDAVWEVTKTEVSADIENLEVCKLINDQANGTDAFVATAQYGCDTTGAVAPVVGTFKYKG